MYHSLGVIRDIVFFAEVPEELGYTSRKRSKIDHQKSISSLDRTLKVKNFQGISSD